MSIWIKDGDSTKLAPHEYERTLIGAISRNSEELIMWVEGSNFEYKIKSFDFGICGGNINTNAGINFTKKELQHIVRNMKEGAIFKVAACNSLSISGVVEDFKKSNNMVQTGHCSFAPSEVAKTLPKYKPS